MREKITDKNIWVIYRAIFLLGLAYGISIALIGLFLDRTGYSKEDIGSLAIWFALGIVTLSLPMGHIIRRYSARSVLIVCLFGYAVTVTMFPFLPTFGAIAAVRFFDGAFSVGVWICCETILLSRAGDAHKAYITSLYAIALAAGYVVGPFVSERIVAFGSMPIAFVVSGVIATMAAIMVFTSLSADAPVDGPTKALDEDASASAGATRAETPGLSLLYQIKTSCFATFAYGYFQASVVLFLPLYLVEAKNISTEKTILIPGFFAAGMLLFSNVAGRLGDRYGHLRLMSILAAIGTVMVLGFVYLDTYLAMCVAVFIAGATLAAISPVSLALQGVVTERRDYSRANSIYNAFYASGMLLGPYLSSRIYGLSGAKAMLFHLAGLWVAFVVFTIVFYRDDPAATRVLPATLP